MKKFAALLPLLTAVFALSADDSTPFRWSLERDGRNAAATVRVAEKFYLYAEQVRLQGTADGKPVRWTAPAPVDHDGEKVYPAGSWTWRADDVPPRAKLAVTVDFQGCSEAGICRLPETVTLAGPPTAVPPSAAPRADALPPFRVIRKLEGLADAPAFLAFLQGGGADTAETATGSWLWMVLLALAGGIALNFTPCVLPLIPINLAIIGAAKGDWKTGLVRASVYGAGMAASYGALGAAAVLTGARFGSLNSSAWFNFVIAGVFLALALAMFGVFNLDFSGLSGKIPVRGKSRSLALVFLLGAVASLLAGACVAPALIAVIVFAAGAYADGNPAGLLMPFVLGLGMALPWPAAGAGLSFLPKPGAWMDRVKAVLGLLILAAAGYYAYLGVTLLPGKYDPDAEIAKVRTALKSGRPVLVDFWASWCKNCRQMDRTTLRDARVQDALKSYEMVKFQAEKLSDPAVKALLDRCGVNGLPAFVLLEPETRP